MFTEWVYINNVWEVFGSIAVDLSGYLTDVQINGASIVNNGIAAIPIAKSGTAGVVQPSDHYGTDIGANSEILKIYQATGVNIKAGSHNYRPITPSCQHESVFYGLAKVAGYDEKNSTLPVGQYTNEAKAAIKDMLEIGTSVQTIEITETDPVITALANTRYKCGEITSLDFTPAASGICDIIFTTGTTLPVITLPATVKMPEWFEV